MSKAEKLLYIAGAPGYGLSKIGVSGDPERRLYDLQREYFRYSRWPTTRIKLPSHYLRLLVMITSSHASATEGMFVEKYRHRRCIRRKREWFGLCPVELADDVVNYMQAVDPACQVSWS